MVRENLLVNGFVMVAPQLITGNWRLMEWFATEKGWPFTHLFPWTCPRYWPSFDSGNYKQMIPALSSLYRKALQKEDNFSPLLFLLICFFYSLHWWFALIVNSTEPGKSWEMGLWACLWGFHWCGRPMLLRGNHWFPDRGILECIQWRGWTSRHCYVSASLNMSSFLKLQTPCHPRHGGL